MRIVDSSDGPEWVAEQNRRIESLERLGTWTATLEGLAYQLVRAGRDLNSNGWVTYGPRMAIRSVIQLVLEETGNPYGRHEVSRILLDEPAAETEEGRDLLERIELALPIVGLYDLMLGASLFELPGDFEALWRDGLEPWLQQQPMDVPER